jgi:segregation and condensation protein B
MTISHEPIELKNAAARALNSLMGTSVYSSETNVVELRSIIESIVFACGPITEEELSQSLNVEVNKVAIILQTLSDEFNRSNRGLALQENIEGWTLISKPEFQKYIDIYQSIHRKPEPLPPDAVEILALIAYKQPLTIQEIIDLRGSHSSLALQLLLQKKLIRVVGRKEVLGLPLMYGTTEEFLRMFGLEDISQLPQGYDLDPDEVTPTTP